MIDYFAIALTHGLIALAAWRLFLSEELDAEPAANAGAARPEPEGNGDA